VYELLVEETPIRVLSHPELPPEPQLRQVVPVTVLLAQEVPETQHREATFTVRGLVVLQLAEPDVALSVTAKAAGRPAAVVGVHVTDTAVVVLDVTASSRGGVQQTGREVSKHSARVGWML
jgi:hypothetical protein